VLRHLLKKFDEFLSSFNPQTKYGKKRLKVDLKYLTKKLSNVKFENEELEAMII